MIFLRQLIAAIPTLELKGKFSDRNRVRGLTSDSRTVEPGVIFVALRGEKVDGHAYIADAIAKGCLAVVAEHEVTAPPGLPIIRVADSHLAYGQMAAAYYDHPAQGMKMVGITGTNGKTTTAWMIERIIETSGGRPGVMGTVNYRYRDATGRKILQDAPLTTPEPMVLQGLLSRMRDAGVTHVILEVSSHALVQKRVAGLEFDIGLFTNLSRDHLDYHKTMEEYFQAKIKLFDAYLKSTGVAVIATRPENKDKLEQTDWGRKVISHLSQRNFKKYQGNIRTKSFITCGLGNDCRVKADSIGENIEGTSFRLSVSGKQRKIKSSMIGLHNISNMLMASGTAWALGIDLPKIKQGLEALESVPGRLERVEMPSARLKEEGPAVFVDYAHTPDALEHVLQTLRPVTTGRLYCIVGCGGDRDRGKRPVMGAIAAQYADILILTSDNPRSEDPAVILSEIERGVMKTGRRKRSFAELFNLKKNQKGYAVETDRRKAIHHACSRAGQGDVILIAGKGHETYQITTSGKRFFDDRFEAKNGAMRWTVEHLVSATGGKVKARGISNLLGNISTDTRTIQPDDVFVALKGDNFDGHDFFRKAVKNGASAVIVQQGWKGTLKNTSLILVKDTLKALGDLAHYRRQLVDQEVKVIAITGSSGKTTVKEMTAAIFEAEFSGEPGSPVLKTEGNLNNLIGLPLSLLKMNGGHRVAVMEMGMNRPGEIERLTGIANPDIGCITNIQAAHLEGLGTIEGVARAKGELFATMADSGVCIMNLDDPQIRKQGGRHGNHVITFAVTPFGRRFNPDVRATRIASLGEKGMRFTLQIGNWKKRITVPATGSHNVSNCTAASAIATAAGIHPEIIIQGLSRYRHGDKRLQIVELPVGIHVVNDSYNANPASMAAALRTVQGFGGQCQRVALLGDMFELGDSAPAAHNAIGSLVAELKYDYLGVTGEYAKKVADMTIRGGLDSSKVRVAVDKEELAGWVLKLISSNRISSGDWLLIKGSRGMRMEKVLHLLQEKLQQNMN